MSKRKPPVIQHRKKEEVNRKALFWSLLSMGVFVIAVTVLLVLDK
ncbi:hypothetical protein [Paenibacillus gansuensis]|uniref:DUF4044 domain-containing protein n=1 Tax=Paenibacillus gansuensis TaxID=306542 RepID=A0ABW5PEF8_9BACL